MLPLHFICTSRYRPHRVHLTPYRYNRRFLLQPCRADQKEQNHSFIITAAQFGAPLRSHLPSNPAHPSQQSGFLCNTKYRCTLFVSAFSISTNLAQKRYFRQGRISHLFLSLIHRLECNMSADIFISRTDDLAGIDQLLQTVCTPARHTGDRKDRCKQFFRNIQH